jgi:hypothetical protein
MTLFVLFSIVSAVFTGGSGMYATVRILSWMETKGCHPFLGVLVSFLLVVLCSLSVAAISTFYQTIK